MGRLGEWLAPPRTGRPADTLRWARRSHLVTAPAGLLIAALLRAQGESWWWFGLVATGLAVVGWLTMGPAIRRAEQRPSLDPATAPERRRRATRVTLVLFGAMMIVAAVVFYLVAGLGAAIFLVVMFTISAVLGFWMLRRWPPA